MILPQQPDIEQVAAFEILTFKQGANFVGENLLRGFDNQYTVGTRNAELAGHDQI